MQLSASQGCAKNRVRPVRSTKLARCIRHVSVCAKKKKVVDSETYPDIKVEVPPPAPEARTTPPSVGDAATTVTPLPTAAAASDEKPKVVVIGAGWAGFGAARHLSSQGYAVTLLDGSPNPGGLSTGWRTRDGKSVEAGMKGFWYQYPNIFSLIKDELRIEWPFTSFTRSGFWSPKGLVTESPVFSELRQLPTLLGQFAHTFPLFKQLPLLDRLSMLPLLYCILDYDSSPETYEKYDQMSARELFRTYGVSENLYESFLKPLLLVGLFAPPEELSAAAVIGTLYFYALGHQNSFDVCWCKGNIAELLFAPMIADIQARGGQVVGSQFVKSVDTSGNGLSSVTAVNPSNGDQSTYETDAVVFAVGVTGLQKLVNSCPALGERQEFARVMNLRGISVISTRLWFDRKVATTFPSNVLSRFDDSYGATFFNLNELQDEYRDAPGSVIAADVYHSNKLMPLSEQAIVDIMHDHIAQCEPGFLGAKVVDFAVLKFPNAVTHFSTGSYASRPLQTTSFDNVFMAGDWVKGVPHGANGLSQERAYVTGLLAANLVVQRLGHGRPADVKPVEADEPQIVAAKQANKAVKGLFEQIGIRSPFI